MARKKLHEGYGETSEQRQRHLEGDNFSERAPQTPEELDEVRSASDDPHEVVTLHPLAPDIPPEE
ncbi:hypothetical protein JGU66_17750 [Myxococcaceae bacterium JPH2]|nr:hypothetical protein [Myxococcaceae bacterium JPH2]